MCGYVRPNILTLCEGEATGVAVKRRGTNKKAEKYAKREKGFYGEMQPYAYRINFAAINICHARIQCPRECKPVLYENLSRIHHQHLY